MGQANRHQRPPERRIVNSRQLKQAAVHCLSWTRDDRLKNRKKGSGASLVKPWKLLTPERLDLAVKYRFFLHLLRGGDQDSERVYRWHIYLRTGGIEGEKSSVDDYVDACHVLL